MRVRASYAEGHLTTPKSGKVRAVPMAPDVARALSQLSQRGDWTADDDLVFPGEHGRFLDASALRRRYAAALRTAGLRKLRFHEYADLLVMPTWARKSWQIGVIAVSGSASRERF